MRILLDQGTPVPLRQALVSHTVSTAFDSNPPRWGHRRRERAPSGRVAWIEPL